jgi:AcrR family transcriptional regulator
MSERKTELLDAAIHYLLEHGVADLSLRPLAQAIGSSARLLIFHFKSKECLLQEVLGEVQQRLQRSLSELPPGGAGRSRTPPMKLFWQRITAPDNLPYLRLLYEVHFIALQNPAVYGQYLQQVSINWVAVIEGRLPESIRNKATATLVAAVFDGLLMELLTTGDLRRTTQALDLAIEMLSDKAYGHAGEQK